MKCLKLKVEIDESYSDEVIIRCSNYNDDIRLLQDVIGNVINKNAELCLSLNNTDYYINRNDILFFETTDSKTVAHTTDKMYYSNYKLYELEQVLPPEFIRVSKSTILNCKKVSSISKNLTGASEVYFKATPKKVYVSRMYFKVFKEKIDEVRL